MSTAKASKKRRTNRRKLQGDKFFERFDRQLALPDAEIRRLAILITNRHAVEPFLRRMALLLDSLNAGQTGKVAQIARRSRDESSRELLSAISRTAKRGHLGTAHTTALLAASYAYQNSLDYLCELLGYLDKLRQAFGKPRLKSY